MRLNLRNSFCVLCASFFLVSCGITQNIGKIPAIYAIQVDDTEILNPNLKFKKKTLLTLTDFSENTMIATIRIPVLMKNNRIRYIKNATWVDTPGAMLNQQLNELLQHMDDNLIVANYQERIRSDYFVQGQLMRFYYNQSTQETEIKLDLKLIKMPGKQVLEEKQFASKIKIERETVEQIVKGFNQGSAVVLEDIQTWLYDTI